MIVHTGQMNGNLLDNPLAQVTRPCNMCLTRQPVASMTQPGPGLFACLDTAACWARQDAGGPQAETGPELELALAGRQVTQGVPALPPDRGAVDISPRTGQVITAGKGGA